MVLLRRILGDTLRAQRLAQRRTLREVSTEAKVSLGYLSEVERGQKEASSELLASICDALGVRLAQVLRDVSDTLEVAEGGRRAVSVAPRQPADAVLSSVIPDDASELDALRLEALQELRELDALDGVEAVGRPVLAPNRVHGPHALGHLDVHADARRVVYAA
jgi:transcriptional regulator with XRE-family HTH domain